MPALTKEQRASLVSLATNNSLTAEQRITQVQALLAPLNPTDKSAELCEVIKGEYSPEQSAKIAKVLVDGGVDPNIAPGEGKLTPLQLAVYGVQSVADGRAEEYKDSSKQNARELAVIKALTDMPKESSHSNDRINNAARYNNGDSLLMCAVLNGRNDMAKLLISQGADLMQVNNDGQNVLHYAAIKGDKQLMDRLGNDLTSVGAYKNLQDKAGRTPLHYAHMAFNQETIDSINSSGYNPNVSDNSGKMPGQYSQGSNIGENMMVLTQLLIDNAGIAGTHLATQRSSEITDLVGEGSLKFQQKQQQSSAQPEQERKSNVGVRAAKKLAAVVGKSVNAMKRALAKAGNQKLAKSEAQQDQAPKSRFKQGAVAMQQALAKAGDKIKRVVNPRGANKERGGNDLSI